MGKFRIIPSIYLYNGNVVDKETKEIVGDGDAVELATFYNNRGADELLVFDLSSSDSEHDANIGTMIKIQDAVDIQMIVGGNVKRLEDVKKYIYTGAKKAILDMSKDANVEIVKEASERFGSDKIAVMLNKDYDFSKIEADLGIDCFSQLSDYHAIQKKELMYNKNVSEKIIALSAQLEAAEDVDAFFAAVTGFYKDYGVGMFGLNKAFRIKEKDGGDVEFVAINNMDKVMLDDLIGYEIQKKKLVDNTKAFVEGRAANNVLLFGDSGTGKSTSIKAIVNEFYPDGLRMIEIYKHQFKDLSNVIASIKNRNYKFIIYMDDLSFEEFEIEYKFLKAVIEGGVETRPDNILIYATSNRRHLIKETWNDRNDVQTQNGMHHSDTMEEKLSLVNRFGVTINYSKPSQKEYFHIVVELARKNGVTEEQMSDETLRAEANKWELSHGGISGRTAQQFINYILGTL